MLHVAGTQPMLKPCITMARTVIMHVIVPPLAPEAAAACTYCRCSVTAMHVLLPLQDRNPQVDLTAPDFFTSHNGQDIAIPCPGASTSGACMCRYKRQGSKAQICIPCECAACTALGVLWIKHTLCLPCLYGQCLYLRYVHDMNLMHILQCDCTAVQAGTKYDRFFPVYVAGCDYDVQVPPGNPTLLSFGKNPPASSPWPWNTTLYITDIWCDHAYFSCILLRISS